MTDERKEEQAKYEKINEELLGILVGTNGEFHKRIMGGNHSAEYYVTMAVVNQLVLEAPKMLDKFREPYLMTADNYNELLGRAVKYIANYSEIEQTKDGKYRMVIPTWKNKKINE